MRSMKNKICLCLLLETRELRTQTKQQAGSPEAQVRSCLLQLLGLPCRACVAPISDCLVAGPWRAQTDSGMQPGGWSHRDKPVLSGEGLKVNRAGDGSTLQALGSKES